MRADYGESGVPDSVNGAAGDAQVLSMVKPVGGAVPLSPGLVDDETVNDALAQVMASGRLRSAVQLRRFLAFVVEESLAGRGDKLKAYTIATRALGRPSDFDPGKDPIVRVEATRLRAALTAYYADEGRDAALRFHMLPGSYRPLVEVRDTPGITVTEPAAQPPDADADLPAITAAEASAALERNDRLVVWLAGAALAVSVICTGLVGFGIYLVNQHIMVVHGGPSLAETLPLPAFLAPGAPAPAPSASGTPAANGPTGNVPAASASQPGALPASAPAAAMPASGASAPAKR
ncbi:hypothetical protein [Blastochloris sulfoviridis]|uniref:Uncharacterized protein n=1 Tax=Blastochloris sulfoviridis TaxID=50712 RepID=A0A5M6I566_9HYPH|nr:hypothetical protein [Blastochloris sulfoviridis]KAA5602939.1 hypothetical protein F1193_03650 [Blastochloris sulfoviridis]